MSGPTPPVTFADYQGSSVNRLSWAALLGVEHWFKQSGITDDELSLWLGHLWQWSTVHPDTFNAWYESRSTMVFVGLGDPFPDRIAEKGRAAGIHAEDLSSVVMATTEVIYTDLFGAIAWDAVSGQFDLLAVVLSRYEIGLPPPECLPASTDREVQGWGNPLDRASVGRIRNIEWTGGC